LFNPDFLDDILPSSKIAEDFPFFDYSGIPFLQLSPTEINQLEQFVLKINGELQMKKAGNAKAIKMYLYLLLLEVKRSYERQQLHIAANSHDHVYLVSRFRKLVSQYFLTKKQVSDYAAMHAVTANHLNRMLKDVTGKPASAAIAEMLLQEAKALLKYTDASVAEIAYQLEFGDPPSFNRFFKKMTGETPLFFRTNA
jgi:AraC family transcriptional activator of pobA